MSLLNFSKKTGFLHGFEWTGKKSRLREWLHYCRQVGEDVAHCTFFDHGTISLTRERQAINVSNLQQIWKWIWHVCETAAEWRIKEFQNSWYPRVDTRVVLLDHDLCWCWILLCTCYLTCRYSNRWLAPLISIQVLESSSKFQGPHRTVTASDIHKTQPPSF